MSPNAPQGGFSNWVRGVWAGRSQGFETLWGFGVKEGFPKKESAEIRGCGVTWRFLETPDLDPGWYLQAAILPGGKGRGLEGKPMLKTPD